ncbi:MAG TPA: hypothetical protein VLT58_09735 [Polyangia bacterium]|nr:hypothetical protein [Polyangia bacterium]
MADRVWILSDGTVFDFDAVLTEQHAQELAIPDEPLETGVEVADHAYLQPARLSIEAAVSDISFHANDLVETFESDTSRSAKAFDLLLKLQASFEPFSVQTGYKLYRNMQIVSLSADQTAQNGSGLIFRAELKQPTFVDTRTVTYTPRAKGKPARQAPKKTDGGQKDAPAVEDTGTKKSVLLNVVGAGSSTGVAISTSNPNLPPNILQMLGPGSSLP